jgi:hypothetical protein
MGGRVVAPYIIGGVGITQPPGWLDTSERRMCIRAQCFAEWFGR